MNEIGDEISIGTIATKDLLLSYWYHLSLLIATNDNVAAEIRILYTG